MKRLITKKQIDVIFESNPLINHTFLSQRLSLVCRKKQKFRHPKTINFDVFNEIELTINEKNHEQNDAPMHSMCFTVI